MFLFANHYENEDPMDDQRQFFNGKTGRVEVTLEPVITMTRSRQRRMVGPWDIEWNGNAEHFTTYAEARKRYDERVKERAA